MFKSIFTNHRDIPEDIKGDAGKILDYLEEVSEKEKKCPFSKVLMSKIIFNHNKLKNCQSL